MEKPKPKTATPVKPPAQKPETKHEPVVKKEEPKKEPERKQEEEQPKDVVKIQPKPKTPPVEPKKEEPKKEEPKTKEPEPQPESENRPSEAVENPPPQKEEAAQTPGVSGFQVDSPNFNFNYYLEMLRDKIQKNWKPPTGMPSKGEFIAAKVKFTVRRDGMIIGVNVEDSSGLAFFDQSALRAVLNSNPAPPLPRAYDEDRLGVHVSFVFGEGNR
jgi:protein TonB